METETLKPGPELDVLVAERLGWHRRKRNGVEVWAETNDAFDPTVTHVVEAWKPSTSIAAAWELVELLKEMGEDKTELFQITWNPCSGWWISSERFEDHGFDVNAPTAPHAICLAFLEATEKR